MSNSILRLQSFLLGVLILCRWPAVTAANGIASCASNRHDELGGVVGSGVVHGHGEVHGCGEGCLRSNPGNQCISREGDPAKEVAR